MNTPRHSCTAAYPSRNGFALVLALTLMAFLVLLMLSLSALVQVEILASHHARMQEGARYNALLGMRVALGQLQELSGPDQRITATAGINDDPPTGAVYWTGVWESREDGQVASDFLGWLVSLPPELSLADQFHFNLSVPAAVNTAQGYRLTDDDWVILIGDASVGLALNPDALAVAARIPVHENNISTGHFAYWVGDEGVKARVNLQYEQDAEGQVDLTALLQTPPYVAVHKMDSAWFGSVEGGSLSLENIERLSQLPLLDAFSDVPLDYFHHLSFYSRGVLSDAMRGGLKSDLTHLLENDLAFGTYFGGPGDSRFMLGVAEAAWPGEGAGFPNGGPNWGIMRSFYRLSQDINSDGTIGLVRPYPDVSDKGAPTQDAYAANHEVHQQNSPVLPVISWFQMGFGLEYLSEPDPGGGGTLWYPRLHVRPVLGLYNPYDIALEGMDYYTYPRYRPGIRIQVGSEDPVEFAVQEVMSISPGSGGVYFRWKIEGVDLQPGEHRFFSLDGPYPLKTGEDGNLAPDWDVDGSYYADITRDSNIVKASQDGITYNSAPEGDSKFGISDNEIARLEFLQAAGAPTPLVEVTVLYDNTGMARQVDLHGPDGPTDRIVGTDRILQAIAAEGPVNSESYSDDLANIGASPTINVIGFGLRTADMMEQSQRQLIDANPRAHRISRNVDGFISNSSPPLPAGWGGVGFDGSMVDSEPPITDFERFSGSLGSTRDNTASVSSTHTVLFHVPRKKPLSLGLFQHANIGKFSRHPAYIVGSSYALSRIPLDQHSVADKYYYDWSYLINRELWDRYYFSGIPQDLNEEQLQDYLSGAVLPPNPRYRFYRPDKAMLSAEMLIDESKPLTAQSVAGRQLVDGAFNVNSVSVPGWKAFLASNAGSRIPVLNPQTGGILYDDPEQETFFYRTPVSYGEGYETTETSQGFWSSYRKLNDDELTALAEAVVEEVKARGPFSSLSDFVNRRLSGVSEHQRKGALQAALDKEINSALSGNLVGSTSGAGLTLNDSGFIPDNISNEDRPASGGTGWLLQGDLLQSLAPFMAVRSDTFIIRAYGDTTNTLTGDVVARAWCEAVVQRLPDPVLDGAVFTEEALIDPPTPSGRRYRIVGFRWLKGDDI